MTQSAVMSSSVQLPASDGLSRWTVAAADTRTAAKWLVGSLAGAAAVIFGAGPIVNRPDLSWSDDWLQLGIAVVSGACGLISLIVLIGQVATVLTPRKISLEHIPAEMQDDLNACAGVRLPSGSETYDDFLRKYRAYQVLAGTLAARLDRLNDSEAGADIERTQLETLLDEAHRNVGVYSRAADGLLTQAEFYSVSSIFQKHRSSVMACAIFAALGALVFQLSLAADTGKASPEHLDEVAYLQAPRPPTSLWNDLALDNCIIGDSVPVVVSGGNGSDSNPYVVTVIKSKDECVPISFDLRNDALTLKKVLAQPVTIRYP